MSGVSEASLAPARSGLGEPRTAVSVSRLLGNKVWRWLRFATDVLSLSLAAGAALEIHPSRATPSHRVVLVGISAAVTLCALYGRRSPDDRLRGSLLDTFTHVLVVVSFAVLVAIGVGSILGGASPMRPSMRMWAFTIVALGASRMALLDWRRRAVAAGLHATPVLIVGAGHVGSRLAQRLLDDPGYGLRPIGLIDSDPRPVEVPREDSPLAVLGGLDDLADVIAATQAGHVILAFSSAPDHEAMAGVRRCQELGIGVSLVPRLYEIINERAALDHVGGLPLVTLRSVDPRGWEFRIKHVMDRTLAFIAMIVLSPVLAAITLAVGLSSPGPILVRRRRVGCNGREFDLLQFRTAREEPDGPGLEMPPGLSPAGMKSVDRQTAIGRLLRGLSIDGLPQLLNVLRGDMSLVGPRPERPDFVAWFGGETAGREPRLSVKSGLTGWAQIQLSRGQARTGDPAEWDDYYIRNWSLRLDLRILVIAALGVLRPRH